MTGAYRLQFVSVSVPTSTSATATVYEDTTGDGTSDNSSTVTLSDGTTEYRTSGVFDATGGNDVWVEVSFESSDVTASPNVSAPLDVIEALFDGVVYNSNGVTDTLSGVRQE